MLLFFFFQAEDGIRDLVRSRGLGDVYKRQRVQRPEEQVAVAAEVVESHRGSLAGRPRPCLLYTSDAADERSSVDLGGRRLIKKKKNDGSRGAQWRRSYIDSTRSAIDCMLTDCEAMQDKKKN